MILKKSFIPPLALKTTHAQTQREAPLKAICFVVATGKEGPIRDVFLAGSYIRRRGTVLGTVQGPAACRSSWGREWSPVEISHGYPVRNTRPSLSRACCEGPGGQRKRPPPSLPSADAC